MKEKIKFILSLCNPFNFDSTIKDVVDAIDSIESRVDHIEKRINTNIVEIKKDIEFYKSMVETIGDTIPDMMWLKDTDGVYHYANKSICDKLLLDDYPLGKTDTQMALAAKQKYGNENHTFGEVCGNSDTVVLKNKKPQRFLEHGKVKGKMMYLEVYKTPFYFNGQLFGVCGTGRDMTDYIEAYNKHNCSKCSSMNNIFEKYQFKEGDHEQ